MGSAFASERDALGFLTAGSPAGPGHRQDGFRLLLGALGLATLVVASSSLLRMLARMNAELWGR